MPPDNPLSTPAAAEPTPIAPATPATPEPGASDGIKADMNDLMSWIDNVGAPAPAEPPEPAVPLPPEPAPVITAPPVPEPTAPAAAPAVPEPPEVAAPVPSVAPPEPGVPPAPEGDITLTRENYDRLLAEVERLAGIAGTAPAPIAAPAPAAAVPPSAPAAEPQQPSMPILQFIDSEGFDRVVSDPVALNELLNRVYYLSQMNTARIMPTLATRLVQEEAYRQSLRRDFYEEHSDLIPHQKYVGIVANEVANAHPDWDIQQVFLETAKETRKRLSISTAVPAAPATAPPAFPSPQRTPPPGPQKLSEVEQDLKDMMEASF